MTQRNLMAFEFTYLHWFQQLEHVPMSLETEQILAPLYKAELQSFLKDFSSTMDPQAKSHYEENLVDSLTNIRNFISSFGRTVQDFFKQDRSTVERTGALKGQGLEGPLGKGGKSQGKSGSKNQPKEPAPPSKPEGQTPIVKTAGLGPVAKPVQPAVLAKAEPQGPPTKAGESASLAVPKETAAAKSVAISAGVPADPQAVEKTKPPLTLASKTRTEPEAISTPSKPERPPVQVAPTAQESDDENEDLQAALLASRQAPSSPQPPSGAQSSESKPTMDLDQQESDLIQQLDRLMAESVRLESLPKPSIMD